MRIIESKYVKRLPEVNDTEQVAPVDSVPKTKKYVLKVLSKEEVLRILPADNIALPKTDPTASKHSEVSTDTHAVMTTSSVPSSTVVVSSDQQPPTSTGTAEHERVVTPEKRTSVATMLKDVRAEFRADKKPGVTEPSPTQDRKETDTSETEQDIRHNKELKQRSEDILENRMRAMLERKKQERKRTETETSETDENASRQSRAIADDKMRNMLEEKNRKRVETETSETEEDRKTKEKSARQSKAILEDEIRRMRERKRRQESDTKRKETESSETEQDNRYKEKRAKQSKNIAEDKVRSMLEHKRARKEETDTSETEEEKRKNIEERFRRMLKQRQLEKLAQKRAETDTSDESETSESDEERSARRSKSIVDNKIRNLLEQKRKSKSDSKRKSEDYRDKMRDTRDLVNRKLRGTTEQSREQRTSKLRGGDREGASDRQRRNIALALKTSLEDYTRLMRKDSLPKITDHRVPITYRHALTLEKEKVASNPFLTRSRQTVSGQDKLDFNDVSKATRVVDISPAGYDDFVWWPGHWRDWKLNSELQQPVVKDEDRNQWKARGDGRDEKMKFIEMTPVHKIDVKSLCERVTLHPERIASNYKRLVDPLDPRGSYNPCVDYLCEDDTINPLSYQPKVSDLGARVVMGPDNVAPRYRRVVHAASRAPVDTDSIDDINPLGSRSIPSDLRTRLATGPSYSKVILDRHPVDEITSLGTPVALSDVSKRVRMEPSIVSPRYQDLLHNVCDDQDYTCEVLETNPLGYPSPISVLQDRVDMRASDDSYWPDSTPRISTNQRTVSNQNRVSNQKRAYRNESEEREPMRCPSDVMVWIDRTSHRPLTRLSSIRMSTLRDDFYQVSQRINPQRVSSSESYCKEDEENTSRYETIAERRSRETKRTGSLVLRHDVSPDVKRRLDEIRQSESQRSEDQRNTVYYSSQDNLSVRNSPPVNREEPRPLPAKRFNPFSGRSPTTSRSRAQLPSQFCRAVTQCRCEDEDADYELRLRHDVSPEVKRRIAEIRKSEVERCVAAASRAAVSGRDKALTEEDCEGEDYQSARTGQVQQHSMERRYERPLPTRALHAPPKKYSLSIRHDIAPELTRRINDIRLQVKPSSEETFRHLREST